MADENRILGLSIEESAVRAVELERGGDGPTLLAADTWANTLPSPGETMSEAGIGSFKDSLDAFIKVNRVKARTVCVALDTGGLFITTIPLPESASREDIDRQIVWELQQFFPDVTPTDFIHDAHRLTVDQGHSIADFLCVAARRQYTRTVQGFFTDRGFKLDLVDADHFGAEQAFRAGYPDSAQNTVLLAGVKKGRLDLSVLRNGTLSGYDFTNPESVDELIDEFQRQQESVAGLQSVVAFGPALDEETLSGLRASMIVPVEILDPYRSVQISSPARLSPGLQLPSHWFSAAVGVALRNE